VLDACPELAGVPVEGDAGAADAEGVEGVPEGIDPPDIPSAIKKKSMKLASHFSH
jgi:hypothetical protein